MSDGTQIFHGSPRFDSQRRASDQELQNGTRLEDIYRWFGRACIACARCLLWSDEEHSFVKLRQRVTFRLEPSESEKAHLDRTGSRDGNAARAQLAKRGVKRRSVRCGGNQRRGQALTDLVNDETGESDRQALRPEQSAQ